MKTIWKSLRKLGYSNYSISNKGKLMNNQTKRITNGSLAKDGYRQVFLNNEKTIKIHILVAKKFVKNKENKPYARHIDRNKQNNRTDNLKWVTPREAALMRPKNTNLGRKVYKLNKNRDKIEEFASVKIVATKLDVSPTTIVNWINKGALRKHGYWVYADIYNLEKKKGIRWKDIVLNACISSISSTGLVKHKRGRITAGTISDQGYAKHAVITGLSTGVTKDSKIVEQYTKEGDLIKSFISIGIASKETGINRSCISNNCHGRVASAGGFMWNNLLEDK